MKKSVENLPPNSYLTNKRKKENKSSFDLNLIFSENDDSFIFIGFDLPKRIEIENTPNDPDDVPFLRNPDSEPDWLILLLLLDIF